MCQVLMSCQRLHEARALLRRFAGPLRQQSSLAEYSPHAGRADRHNVGIEHHERQPPVAFQRVLQMEPDDSLLLTLLQPEIAGNPAVVLVHLAVAFPPVVELAGGDVEPLDEPPGAVLEELLLQRWKTVGCKPSSSQSFEMGSFSSKCRLRTATPLLASRIPPD